jgi:hypothetical protein
MDLRETGWVSVEWIQLAQDRDWWWVLVNTVMNLQVLAPRRELVSFITKLLCAISFIVSRTKTYTQCGTQYS